MRLWDVRTGAFVRALGNNRNYTAAATALSFSKDGLLLAVGSDDTQIHLWEVSSGVLINRIRDLHAVRQIALSPDSKLVATVGNSNSVVVWQLSEQPTRTLLRGSPSFLNSLAFDPSGKLVLAANQSGTLLAWQLDSPQQPLSALTAYEGQAISAFAISPAGTHLITASAAGMIKVWAVPAVP